MIFRQTNRVSIIGIFFFCALFPVISFGQSVEDLIKKSVEFYTKKNYPQCLAEAQKAVSLAEKKAIKDPTQYYHALENLAGAYNANMLPQKAEQTLNSLANLSFQKFGPQHETSVYYFELLFNYYENNYPPQKKIAPQTKLLISRVNALENAKLNHTDLYDNLQVNLAKIHFKEKEYEKALKIYETLANDTIPRILKKEVLVIDPDPRSNYAAHYETEEIEKKRANTEYWEEMATCYYMLGNFDMAVSINNSLLHHYFEKNETERKLYTIDILNLLFNLEDIYSLQGKVPELKNTIELEISFIQSFKGKMWDSYVESLLKLAKLQIATGEHDKALILFSLIKNYFEFEPDLQKKMTNQQAVVYLQLGQTEKALPLLSAAFNECAEHKEHHASCINLFLHYPAFLKDARAKDLLPAILQSLQKELKETEDVAGKNNWLTLDLKEKIAQVYQLSGRYKEAIQMQTELAKKWESLLGIENHNYINACYHLSQLYQQSGQYKLAINEGMKTLQWMEKNTSMSLAPIPGLNAHISSLYEKDGQVSKAFQCYHEGLEKNYQKINRYFPVLTEKEKEDLIQSMEMDFRSYQSYSIFYKDSLKTLNQNLYNLCLNRKGLILHSRIQRDKMIEASDNKDLLYLQKSRESIAKKILDNNQQRNPSLAKETIEMEKSLEEIERKIGALLVGNETTNIVGHKKWQQIQEKLLEDEVAIEFIDYPLYNDSTKRKLAALLIRKDSEQPIFVDLGDEKDLADFLQQQASKDYDHIRSKYGTQLSPNSTLYNKIFKPLEKHLQNIRKIYYSPSGILNKVSFGALFINDREMLIDRYELEQLHSTGQLLTSAKINIESTDKFLLAGGIVYSADSSKTQPWSFLPGTLEEIHIIQNLLSKDSASVKSFYRNFASEKRIKRAFMGKEVIHIATHGFYFPNPRNQNAYPLLNRENLQEKLLAFRGTKIYADWNFIHHPDPLMRSGLVLANANETWLSEKGSSEEDGILTAKEISLMDLSYAKLVVLSACNTALGDYQKEEGVYGLQRALKMAGADHLLISLWQVPDQETAAFMEIFYRELLQTKNIQTAFRNTQKNLRNKNYDPYYWGAFVLVR
jgi:CHAT domain-containing protein